MFAQDAADWTGFYAGVFGGYALDKEQATSSEQPPVTSEVGDDGNTITFSSTTSNGRIAGGFGGVRAGYLAQHGIVVFGAEASLGGGALGKSTENSAFEGYTDNGPDDEDRSFTFDYDTSSQYRLNWMASLEGKIGIVPTDNWLFYLKGGVVFADASSNSSLSIESTGDPGPILGGLGGLDGLTSTASDNGLLVGGTVGVGVEAMVTDHISANLEYAFVNLPDYQSTAASLGTFLGEGTSTSGAVFGNQIHTVKAGLNYHF